VSGTAFERIRAAAPALSVGMATADLLRLGEEIAVLERAGVPCVHFDVMDGRFTPTLTFGPPIVAAVRTSLLKDVHLMIEDPLATVAEYVAAGADVVTIHAESTRHPHRVLQALGQMKNANDPSRGIVRGLALNPGTPLEVLDPLLDDCELVLLLAVNPGWGGQKFIPSTSARAHRVRHLIEARDREVLLCVDGGVKRDNVAAIAELGADLIVTGSAVFDGKDALANARALQDAVRAAAAAVS
jgi:ribulose-phosphate 3-epimerase